MKGRIIRLNTEPQERLTLPIIGKIKVGLTNDTGFPRSVDYFVASGMYKGLFSEAYGEKPQTIQIIFTDDDPAKVCREEYEYRNNEGKLIAKGDGSNFLVWDGKQYTMLTIDNYPNLLDSINKRYPNRKVQQYGNGWDITLTLNFLVPMIKGVIGLWQFKSKGAASTIPQIRDTYDCMLQQRGFCKGIIFDLSVQFAKSQKPGVASRYPVVSLVPNESEANIAKLKQAYEQVKFLKD